MKFGIEKCAKLLMKNGKLEITEGIELLKKENIRMLGEKENYKSLGILEADPIKQEEMKENIKMSISDKRESFSKPNSAAGLPSKENMFGRFSF